LADITQSGRKRFERLAHLAVSPKVKKLEFAGNRAKSPNMTHPIRLLCLSLAIIFTALIGWASVRGDFGAEFAAITAMPWGRISLIDLYLGFLLFGFAVWVVEKDLKTRLVWALPVLVLGNAWSLVWVAVRWNQILGRLKTAPAEPPKSDSNS
jgi:hypothetical protein